LEEVLMCRGVEVLKCRGAASMEVLKSFGGAEVVQRRRC
jgi:hypothetical protein